jgi:hypothetical protein
MSDHGLSQGDPSVIRGHKAMRVHLETGFLETIDHESKKKGILKHPAAQDNSIQAVVQMDFPACFYHKPSHSSMELS